MFHHSYIEKIGSEIIEFEDKELKISPKIWLDVYSISCNIGLRKGSI